MSNPDLLVRAKQRWTQCSACDLAQQRQQVVFGEGSPTARVLIFGESPTEEDERSGRPFEGSAGRLLRAVLHKVGIPQDAYFFSSVVLCRPYKNRVPMPYEADACRGHIDMILAALEPRVVLMLGAVAATALGGMRDRITKGRGRILDVPWVWKREKQKTRGVATYSPLFVLRRGPSSRENAEFERDLRLAAVLSGLAAGDVSPHSVEEGEDDGNGEE